MSTDDALDPADAYRLIRFRVDSVLRDLTPDQAGKAVPCCPGWTVRALLSHLVGACTDIVSGNLDGAGTQQWTAAQVGRRVQQDVPELLTEWGSVAEDMIAAHGGRHLGQTVTDALTHEYDLRGALGLPPHRPDLVLPGALGWLTRQFGRHLDAQGIPTLRLATERGELLVGGGMPAGTLSTGTLDAVRTFTGRRTREQTAALNWDVDPTRWLDALRWGPFTPPRSPSDYPAALAF